MNLICHTINRLAIYQFSDNIRIACCRNKSREPVQPGENPIFNFTGRNMTWPANERRHAEAAFKSGALAGSEWRLTTIGPGEIFSAVVGCKYNDGIIIQAIVFQIFHDGAYDIV